MDQVWAWLNENKEWLFSGAAIALPLAIVGWLFSKKEKSQSQVSGDNSTNIQVAGDFKLGTLSSSELTSKRFDLAQLGSFQFEITQDALRFEELQEQARVAGEDGNIENGRAAFMQSATLLRRIVDRYRSNRHLFTEQQCTKIDETLCAAEVSEDDQLPLLITGIQTIKSAVDQNIAKANVSAEDD